MPAFSYKVRSHELHDEDTSFVMVRLRLFGYATKDAHPDRWDFDLLVPTAELGEWPLGSLKRLGLQ